MVPDLNARMAKSKSVSMTVAQLCSHFEQCELSLANTWRSYSTKTIYKVYLKRWIIPKWSEHLLSDIRTIEVESWLRSLPIARSTCAKIRNVMSVLFNHACRYEFFDGNPIRLVRQSAKRRSPPVVLTAGEIRILLEGLKIRERTLVFIAASTGIRQSELFALKWGDINFSAGTMNVARSIVHGFVGPCKTESSQKPVPIHPLVCEALVRWKEQSLYRQPEDWVFASRHSHGKQPYWGQAILHKYLRPAARELGIETAIRLAHVPAHVLNALEKRWHRVQGDAGAATTFDYPIDPGCLHSGNHTGQAECAGRCHVVGLLFSVKSEAIYKDAALDMNLGANWVQNAPNLHPISPDFSSPNHPVSHLECMAGTTGLEPATSAVTGQHSNLISGEI